MPTQQYLDEVAEQERLLALMPIELLEDPIYNHTDY